MSAEFSSLHHFGLTNRSEEQALSFYQGFLGFDHTRDFVVAPELSGQLFSVPQEIKVLVFEKRGVKIEVFIHSVFSPHPHTLSHIGLTVNDLGEFIAFASVKGIPVIKGTHKEKTVYFVKDLAGNLFEIKEG